MLRRAEGVSRKKLADELRVSPETLAYIERAEREPGVTLAWRIAAYFELPLELVFSDKPLPTFSELLREHYQPCGGYSRKSSLESSSSQTASSQTSSQTGRG